MAYLYGASVQGIQGFIFQTNKLKEIVGASELVEQICTNEFDDFCEKQGIQLSSDDTIIKAAGNIKYLFQSDEDCKKVVRDFPKHIANLAPGITISQAVVKCSENLPDAINELETKLKAQRNKASMPVETGFMGLKRDRRAGGVAYIERYKRKGGIEEICEATHKKRRKSDPDYQYKDDQQKENLFFKISNKNVSKYEVAHDVEKIAESGKNAWLAVIHADGNALGILLQKLSEKLQGKTKEEVQKAFATFSKNLDFATKNAAQDAFDKVINADMDKLRKNLGEEDKNKTLIYPIRPVILGGDDLTVIIRADLALDFTIKFLEAFENETKTQFKFLKNDYQVEGFENGITACAGIAYIKEKYPFHYGVHLADLLTGKAKKFSKEDKFKKYADNENINIPPSSISFYKVQSSFIESLEDMTEKTLTAKISNVSFDYGPYLIHPDKGEPNVEMLDEKLKELAKEAAPENDKSKCVSKLRQWISELYKDKSTADFMMTRMEQTEKSRGVESLYKRLNLANTLEEIIYTQEQIAKNKEQNKKPLLEYKTIIYDVIQLHSLKY
ncbi:hypothetical protein [Cellulophaga sp. BC115SP]|uniref:Cas10/Cmr2 second palm domain-containing protein n=1 Tax=Cellulophaga sp. BC115SP TaxID=2683263 RepID=UPI001413422A|nr:hypothetical protein [Cellulophaga sp. BC115SP]NBB31250.1 hypothetical protein [Cellulophaga sp. BC115SP]